MNLAPAVSAPYTRRVRTCTTRRSTSSAPILVPAGPSNSDSAARNSGASSSARTPNVAATYWPAAPQASTLSITSCFSGAQS
jgi:hypothetical protein